MKLSYEFSNVFGSIYHKGTLLFACDNTLLSPVGNKIVTFDIKNCKSEALSIETDYNISQLSLSPNGALLLVASEKTHLYMVSLISGRILHRKEFKDIGEKINALQFSPNGQYYAVCGGFRVLVYLTPGFVSKGKDRQITPFRIHKIINSHDDACSIAWSGDSKLLAIGSKSMTIKVYPIDRTLTNVPFLVNLSGHTDHVIACFFDNKFPNELNMYTLSRNRQLFVWECNYSNCDDLMIPHDDSHGQKKLLNYRKLSRHNFNEHLKDVTSSVNLVSCDYHSKSKLLVTGFNNGVFLLHEMPDFVLIHSLELSTNGGIDSIKFNNSGDWIGIGSGIGSGNKFDIGSESSSLSQLIVWEWQSESFVLKQSGSGAGVTNVSECVAYSPDATLLASGGTEGKVKIWNMLSGFCTATFADEHRGPITAIEFVPGKSGTVLLTASLDGTLRAFDLNRYRNFRTLAGPSESKSAQFISMAIDGVSGDIVAAGAHNFFEIFLWSLQTGRLLECLTGHEGPVSGVAFSPHSNTLVSCSWDRTVRIWDLFDGSKCSREMITVGSDVLALAFRPDGHQFAISTLNGNITFFDVHSGEQNGAAIEGTDDLGMSHYETELVKDKNKYFSTLNYSADGSHIIAAGKSKYLCIYHVTEKLLMKKFAITWNLSMDGLFDYINKRKVAEFGFNMSLIKNRNEDTNYASIELPGVSKSDFSSRSVNPIIAIYSVRFSPTMRTFVAASTEGIMIYSLDRAKTFDPYQLEINITPQSVMQSLHSKEYCDALMKSIKLNEQKLVENVIESVPINEISFVIANLPLPYVEKCIRSLAIAMESTKHIEFYLKWCQIILYQYGTNLKNNVPIESLSPTLRLLQQNMIRNYEDIRKICEHNKYLLRFLQILGHHRSEDNVNENIDMKDEIEDESDSLMLTDDI